MHFSYRVATVPHSLLIRPGIGITLGEAIGNIKSIELFEHGTVDYLSNDLKCEC